MGTYLQIKITGRPGGNRHAQLQSSTLDKWWWNLISQSSGTVQRLSRSKYGPQMTIWRSKLRNSSGTSGPQKGINSSRSIFWPRLSYKNRKGKYGIILGEQMVHTYTISIIMSTPLQLDQRRGSHIREHWARHRWSLQDIACTTSHKRAQKANLLTMLNQVKPPKLTQDFPIWRWKPHNNFFVRYAYRMVKDSGCRLLNAKYTWKVRSSLKVKYSCGYSQMNARLTWNNLERQRWHRVHGHNIGLHGYMDKAWDTQTWECYLSNHRWWCWRDTGPPGVRYTLKISRESI